MKNIFYKQLASDLYRFAYFKLGNKHDAEDLVSESVTRLLESKQQLSITETKKYAFGIIKNVLKDKYKEKVKKISGLDVDVKIVDEDINIENEIVDNDKISIIKDNLELLGKDTKEIIILKIWEDFRFEEIAKIRKEKLSSVKMRFYRGLKQLEKRLKETITLGIIFAGILALKDSNEFRADPKFLVQTSEKLSQLNNFNLTNMKNIKEISDKGGRTLFDMIKNIADKFIQASPIIKVVSIAGVAIGSITLVGVVSTAIQGFTKPNTIVIPTVIVSPTSNVQLPTETPTVTDTAVPTTVEPTINYLSFTYSKDAYSISFKYRSTFGKASSKLSSNTPCQSGYLKISFSANSKAYIEMCDSYEGGSGVINKIESYTLKSKDGKTFNITIGIQNGVYKITAVYNHTNITRGSAKTTIYITTTKNYASDKVIMQELINSMSVSMK